MPQRADQEAGSRVLLPGSSAQGQHLAVAGGDSQAIDHLHPGPTEKAGFSIVFAWNQSTDQAL